MTGRLIVFEGVEGCGKTTQLQRSREWLQRLPDSEKPRAVVVTREPGGTKFGLGLRKLLLQEGARGEGPRPSAELLLFAADRAQHVEEVLKPQLALGAIILCDRYTDSTIAYQGCGRGMSMEIIEQINTLATGGLQSDLTILLDIDPEISLKRKLANRKLDRIEKTDLAFHHRVRNGYLTLANKYPDRIVVVNAAQPPDEITLHIQNILHKFIQLWVANL